MNIANSTHNATWRRRGKIARKKWSANAVAAKERKRIERAEAPMIDEPKWTPPKLRRAPYATVSLRIGTETTTFRVLRFDEKRLLCRGKVQAASSIGKRIALVMENLL